MDASAPHTERALPHTGKHHACRGQGDREPQQNTHTRARAISCIAALLRNTPPQKTDRNAYCTPKSFPSHNTTTIIVSPCVPICAHVCVAVAVAVVRCVHACMHILFFLCILRQGACNANKSEKRYLQQQLHTLDGGNDSLGDTSRHTTRCQILEEVHGGSIATRIRRHGGEQSKSNEQGTNCFPSLSLSHSLSPQGMGRGGRRQISFRHW